MDKFYRITLVMTWTYLGRLRHDVASEIEASENRHRIAGNGMKTLFTFLTSCHGWRLVFLVTNWEHDLHQGYFRTTGVESFFLAPFASLDVSASSA